MKKLIVLLLLVLAILVVTLAARPPSPTFWAAPVVEQEIVSTGDYAKELAAADNALRDMLRDYDSAKLVWDTELVDGNITVHVNAKNGYGGYMGPMTFTFYHGIVVGYR